MKRACCWHLAAWFGVVKISAALPARGSRAKVAKWSDFLWDAWVCLDPSPIFGNKVGDVRRDPLPKGCRLEWAGLLVAESAGEEEGCECGKGCRLV